MPQADGKQKLQRIRLRIVDDMGATWEYGFKINPESYSESFPQRVSSHKTRSAVIVEDFGPDTPTISFSGTTGFGNLGNTNNGTGESRMQELKEILARYANAGHRINNEEHRNLEMFFYNDTDGGAYVVHLMPEGYSIERSAEQSLLYKYEINLMVIRDASIPSPYRLNEAKINANPVSGGKLGGSTHSSPPSYYAGRTVGYRLEA